jgi:hypothetical protein
MIANRYCQNHSEQRSPVNHSKLLIQSSALSDYIKLRQTQYTAVREMRGRQVQYPASALPLLLTDRRSRLQ